MRQRRGLLCLVGVELDELNLIEYRDKAINNQISSDIIYACESD